MLLIIRVNSQIHGTAANQVFCVFASVTGTHMIQRPTRQVIWHEVSVTNKRMYRLRWLACNGVAVHIVEVDRQGGCLEIIILEHQNILIDI